MTKITQRERQIIFQMWKDGATQKEIAEAIKVSPSALRSEMSKGYTGERYIGGRRVYDPMRAELCSGPMGRPHRKLLAEQEAGRISPPQ
ncbi:MAG TPA: helix-turn-helix domain-containing protein [Candidatus Agathobaculum pullicola]|nr:helix-turn-helix domain-containing protein [Candidatus Agathobaculum pullicola]